MDDKSVVRRMVNSHGPTLLILLPCVVLFGLLFAYFTPNVRISDARSESMNNLKQLIIACHDYAHDHDDIWLARAICDENGKPLLSWRVAMLPYIEYNPLYEQFKLDEAWDSPHNIKLLKQMPNTYRHRAVPYHEGLTCYQCFAGENTLLSKNKLTWQQIKATDKPETMIVFVEAAKPVPWTKPEDIPFNANKPLPMIGNLYGSNRGFVAAMADGSVRWIGEEVSEQTLRRAITWNDGLPLGNDW